MYFDSAEEDAVSAPIVADLDVRVVFSLNALALLVLGIFPNGLLALCAAAFN